MNFDDVLAQEEYLFEEASDAGQTVPLDSLVGCPFCGSDGYVEKWELSNYWSVGCTKCQCTFKNIFETESQAIQFWNTRAPNVRNEARKTTKE